MGPTSKHVLDALLGNRALPEFPTADVEHAKKLALNPDAASVESTQMLPEPLALAVLEAAVRAKSLALPTGLASSTNKNLAKAAKKALYQLKSQGVELPPPERPAPAARVITSEPADELPHLLSSITGTGERALLVARPLRGGGVEITQMVFDDVRGIHYASRTDIARGAYRRQLKELSQAGAPPTVSINSEEARELLSVASAINLRAREPFPAGVDEVLRRFAVEPKEVVSPLPEPLPEDARLAVHGHELHQQPEIQAWLPPEPELRALASKADTVAHGLIEISPVQKRDQVINLFRATAREFFTESMRHLYARRLWQMGDFFERTGRSSVGTLARAEARTLFHAKPDAPLSRFAEFLFEKVFHLMSREQGPQPPSAPAPEEKRSTGGLILP